MNKEARNKKIQGIQMSIKVNSNTDYISAIAKPQDSELIKQSLQMYKDTDPSY